MRKRRQQIRTFYDLAFKAGTAVKLVNLVTIYRIITFPLLVYLIWTTEWHIFKWFLAMSFLTDAIDGILARKFDAYSILGARLDSVGDDLTVLAGAIGLAVFKWDFILSQLPVLTILFALYLVQLISALYKYGKPTNFHTYLAKIAAVLQGLFLILIFFLPETPMFLYYPAVILTGIQLIEELIMVFMIQYWKTDIKGIYWYKKQKAQRSLN